MNGQEMLDLWNIEKKRISTTKPRTFFKERDVWMCSLGKNIGFEQNGAGNLFSRPILVVKKFNNHMLWAIPLSTKQKDIDFYYSFFDPQDHDVSAILAQLRLIGTERLKRKMYTLEKETYSEIKKLIKNLLD